MGTVCWRDPVAGYTTYNHIMLRQVCSHEHWSRRRLLWWCTVLVCRLRTCSSISCELFSYDVSNTVVRIAEGLHHARSLQDEFNLQLGRALDVHRCGFVLPSDLIISHMPALQAYPHRSQVARLVAHALWALTCERPSLWFASRLRVLHDAACVAWYAMRRRTGTKDMHLLLATLSAVLGAIELRQWACCGNRLRSRARQRFGCFLTRYPSYFSEARLCYQ